MGRLCCRESKRHGTDIPLGPMINVAPAETELAGRRKLSEPDLTLAGTKSCVLIVTADFTSVECLDVIEPVEHSGAISCFNTRV